MGHNNTWRCLCNFSIALLGHSRKHYLRTVLFLIFILNSNNNIFSSDMKWPLWGGALHRWPGRHWRALRYHHGDGLPTRAGILPFDCQRPILHCRDRLLRSPQVGSGIGSLEGSQEGGIQQWQQEDQEKKGERTEEFSKRWILLRRAAHRLWKFRNLNQLLIHAVLFANHGRGKIFGVPARQLRILHHTSQNQNLVKEASNGSNLKLRVHDRMTDGGIQKMNAFFSQSNFHASTQNLRSKNWSSKAESSKPDETREFPFSEISSTEGTICHVT